HLALANRPPEASSFSVKLVQQGLRSTSPIHLSLLEAQQFAWRTRIVSSQDSKSFPGPFIVVEISKGIEDGLSIVVSPLLKIHNETDFSLELRFQRPQHEQTESASLILKAGEVIDDAITAFSAIDLSGGSRKALTSLNVGNYIFSFRPNIADGPRSFGNSSIEWSDELKGGKTVCLSGLFNKLSYKVRKAFSVNPTKFSLSSASCAVKSEVGSVTNIYFLIQTVGKPIPIVNPDSSGYAPGNRNPVAMQEQKELFLLPTIQVNLHLVADPHSTMDSDNTWSQATISSGSAVNFYANPATIYFVVTLTFTGSSCKPVNSSDWLRKLQRQKGDISHLDIELDFGGGKYSAMLRLSRGQRGTLQAGIFTSYVLQNDTDAPLFCFSANQKPLSRGDIESFGTDYAGAKDDRKSTSGYCTYVGGNLVTWRSKKQTTVARSSAEAEYRAMAHTTSEILWLKNLLKELGFMYDGPVPMHCDNQAAIHIAINPIFHERTKHIEVDCHFVHEAVMSQEICSPFTPSSEQRADIFTKALGGKPFDVLCNKLGMIDIFAPA
ncbi:Retrovirus-related Pol polyprotein from transposon RE1, partial [Sesamum angolense]